MRCDFCGNPQSLCKLLFEPLNQMGIDKPISDSHICDACVRKAYATILAKSSQEAKEIKKNYYKAPLGREIRPDEKKDFIG